MVFVRWYRNSFLASLISIFGCVMVGAGIMGAFEGSPEALVIVPFGALFMIWAKSISEGKAFQTWVKTLTEKGIDAQVRSNMQVAVKVYNANPGKRTQQWVASLNPEAGKWIAANTKK